MHMGLTLTLSMLGRLSMVRVSEVNATVFGAVIGCHDHVDLIGLVEVRAAIQRTAGLGHQAAIHPPGIAERDRIAVGVAGRNRRGDGVVGVDRTGDRLTEVTSGGVFSMVTESSACATVGAVEGGHRAGDFIACLVATDKVRPLTSVPPMVQL